MPKASVNENDRAVLWKNDIRASRELFHIFSIPKSLGKQILPNHFLGLGSLAPDAGHIVASHLGCMIISHFLSSMQDPKAALRGLR